MAHLEKEVAFVLGKIEVRVGTGDAGKFFDLVHGFLGNKKFDFAVESYEFVVGFCERQPVAVRRHHC